MSTTSKEMNKTKRDARKPSDNASNNKAKVSSDPASTCSQSPSKTSTSTTITTITTKPVQTNSKQATKSSVNQEKSKASARQDRPSSAKQIITSQSKSLVSAKPAASRSGRKVLSAANEPTEENSKELLISASNEANQLHSNLINKNSTEEEEEETIFDDSEKLLTPEEATRPVSSRSVSKRLPSGWEEHSDSLGTYYWHKQTGLIQRLKPSKQEIAEGSQLISVCHDDEEIDNSIDTAVIANGAGFNGSRMRQSKTVDNFMFSKRKMMNRNLNSRQFTSIEHEDKEYYNQLMDERDEEEESEFYDVDEDEDELGAALTVDDSSETTFIVKPTGSCELDETELISGSTTRVIQRCIYRLTNKPEQGETNCWGYESGQPIEMKLFDDYIQFKDVKSSNLIRSQPIHAITSWAVDDDNNFAFIVEDRVSSSTTPTSSEEIALTSGELGPPIYICYVFHSVDDEDQMSCKVSSRLSEVINRYRELMNARIERSTRIQQMQASPVVSHLATNPRNELEGDQDEDQDVCDNELDEDELTLNVRYIGSTLCTRPMGIDVLNLAIDKCLGEASQKQARANSSNNIDNNLGANEDQSSLIEVKLHTSPSSVIVENDRTGEILVECRIRYLTFIGISKRDTRWFGFIMQNSARNKTFIAHTFECLPTAAQACEAIQASCMRMYDKVVKSNSISGHQAKGETLNISSRAKLTPSTASSILKNTIAKTFSRMKVSSRLAASVLLHQ